MHKAMFGGVIPVADIDQLLDSQRKACRGVSAQDVSKESRP